MPEESKIQRGRYLPAYPTTQPTRNEYKLSKSALIRRQVHYDESLTSVNSSSGDASSGRVLEDMPRTRHSSVLAGDYPGGQVVSDVWFKAFPSVELH